MIKAVIFDMDGVLASTTDLQSQAESTALAKLGIDVSPKTLVNTYSGWKDADVFTDVLKHHASKADPYKLREEKWKIIYKKLKDESITPIPNVIDLIKTLDKHGLLLAVASASPLKFIETVLEELGLKEKFKTIVSGDNVQSGKPNPDIFLLTAKGLNIRPQECIVIEDSPNGIQAAKRAGMKCIAITTTAKKEELKKADKIIGSFNEISVRDIQNL